MTARDDDRDAAIHMRKAHVEQYIALAVRQQELLRIVGENADAVDLLVDHAVEHAALAVEIDVTGIGERRRGNREHAGHSHRHSALAAFSRSRASAGRASPSESTRAAAACTASS